MFRGIHCLLQSNFSIIGMMWCSRVGANFDLMVSMKEAISIAKWPVFLKDDI